MLGRAFSSGTETAFWPEVPLARDVIHLDANPVGILEQHGVVAGREVRGVLGRVHDRRSELVDDEAMNRLDVLTAAGAEAHVVKPCPQLVEAAAAFRLRIRAHEDTRPAPDAVDEVVALDERLHLEEVAELLPEGDARPVDHGELDVRHAVQFDAHPPLLRSSERLNQ